MITVGIIGFGKMGWIGDAAVTESSRVRVVGVADPDALAVDGIETKDSAGNIFRAADLDAVFMCTPNDLNEESTLRALSCGKHVFFEKPPALTAADVCEVMRVEEQASDAKGLSENSLDVRRMAASTEKHSDIYARPHEGDDMANARCADLRSAGSVAK